MKTILPSTQHYTHLALAPRQKSRSWSNPKPQLVINATQDYGLDLAVDGEHTTEIKGPNAKPPILRNSVTLRTNKFRKMVRKKVLKDPLMVKCFDAWVEYRVLYSVF
jgi:hypothetical protein